MELYAVEAATLVGRSLSPAQDLVRTLRAEELTPASLPAILAERAAQTPDQVFVETASQRLTYLDVSKLVAQLSQRLREDCNQAPRERIAIAMGNSTEYIVSLLAVMAADLVAVPIPPDTELNRLKRILGQAAPRLILTSSAWANRLQSAVADQQCGWELDLQPEPQHVPADLAAIFFTSGSTGEPKGVMLTHTNLTSNAASIAEYLELTSSDRAAVVVPFYHALGNSILTSHLFAGASVIPDTSIMFPEVLLDTIDRHSVTNLAGVPEIFHRLLGHSTLPQRSLNSLRFMSVAGGMLNMQAVDRMRQAIDPARFFVMYGQTEGTARLAYLPPEFLDQKLGSIGRAVPGVRLQIVSENGHVLEPGQPGELRACGPNISPGYWNDPTSTAQIFQGQWLHTTDHGRIDEDGFVFLTGRKNSFLKRYGFRMHPAEIDQFLMPHMSPGQSVTVAFSRDGEPGLAVFAQPARHSSCSREELMRLCTTQLPRYKQPDYLEIIDEFPLNDAMKIDHQALRQRARKCA